MLLSNVDEFLVKNYLYALKYLIIIILHEIFSDYLFGIFFLYR